MKNLIPLITLFTYSPITSKGHSCPTITKNKSEGKHPSPAFVRLTKVRQRLLPLPRGEGKERKIRSKQ